MGGPPVFPQLPASEVQLYEQAIGGDPPLKYVPSTGSDLHRRSIYVFYKRSLLYPPFAIFDGPNRETCTIRRSKSNTPLQALVVLNEPLFLDCARHLAWVIWHQTGMSVKEKLTLAFRQCTGRLPNSAELMVLNGYLEAQTLVFSKDARRLEN